jgi:hypothetical protein
MMRLMQETESNYLEDQKGDDIKMDLTGVCSGNER